MVETSDRSEVLDELDELLRWRFGRVVLRGGALVPHVRNRADPLFFAHSLSGFTDDDVEGRQVNVGNLREPGRERGSRPGPIYRAALLLVDNFDQRRGRGVGAIGQMRVYQAGR
jgi:hypothetical protein